VKYRTSLQNETVLAFIPLLNSSEMLLWTVSPTRLFRKCRCLNWLVWNSGNSVLSRTGLWLGLVPWLKWPKLLASLSSHQVKLETKPSDLCFLDYQCQLLCSQLMVVWFSGCDQKGRCVPVPSTLVFFYALICSVWSTFLWNKQLWILRLLSCSWTYPGCLIQLSHPWLHCTKQS